MQNIQKKAVENIVKPLTEQWYSGLQGEVLFSLGHVEFGVTAYSV